MIVSFAVNDRVVRDKFATMSRRVHDKMLAAQIRLGARLVDYIRSVKLSSGNPLNIRSGKLSESIGSNTEDSGSFISTTVFSQGLPYARIHEFGGDVYPVNAKALIFEIGGKKIFSQHVRIPERSYLRSSLIENKANINAALRRAVKDAVAE
jgi:phage gpG-like protein